MASTVTELLRRRFGGVVANPYEGFEFGKSMDSFGRTTTNNLRFNSPIYPSVAGHTYTWFGLWINGGITCLNVHPSSGDYFRGGYTNLTNATQTQAGTITITTGYAGGENGGLRFTGLLTQIDDWWAKDETTGEYLYKGKNVE